MLIKPERNEERALIADIWGGVLDDDKMEKALRNGAVYIFKRLLLKYRKQRVIDREIKEMSHRKAKMDEIESIRSKIKIIDKY